MFMMQNRVTHCFDRATLFEDSVRVRSRKGESSRAEIVREAMRLFATKGYESTSIQQVADAVGRSQSAVMHYFPAKVDLFAGVLEVMVAENERIRAEYNRPEGNALERLMNHFEINWRWGVETAHHAQIMTGLFHFASYDPTFNAFYTSILSTARGRVLELLHAGAREKLFPLPPNPERAAEILHDALLGFLLTAVASKRAANEKTRQLAKWRLLVSSVTNH